jgi:hypothetical protein
MTDLGVGFKDKTMRRRKADPRHAVERRVENPINAVRAADVTRAFASYI